MLQHPGPQLVGIEFLIVQTDSQFFHTTVQDSILGLGRLGSVLHGEAKKR